jgi:hypothetical protein
MCIYIYMYPHRIYIHILICRYVRHFEILFDIPWYVGGKNPYHGIRWFQDSIHINWGGKSWDYNPPEVDRICENFKDIPRSVCEEFSWHFQKFYPLQDDHIYKIIPIFRYGWVLCPHFPLPMIAADLSSPFGWCYHSSLRATRATLW